MKREGRRVLLIICCVLLCLVILREIGIVDVHLYKSVLLASQSATKTHLHTGQEKQVSYHLTVKHRRETFHTHTHSYNNLPPIEIEAVLEEPVYSGNFSLPLIKNFKMPYLCAYETTNSPSGSQISGRIEGEVNVSIRGFCSRRKAKEVALQEAKKQITSYFQKQFNL